MPAFLKNKWLWIGLALIVVLIVGFMLFSQASAAKKVELEKAAAEKVESPYAAIANGKADVEGGVIAVAARRGGVVRDVYVNEGDRVVAGQILARQEDDELRLAVQSAQATVAETRAQLGMTEVELTAARREYDRLSRLASTNFVAAQRLD
jgi:HlyD family secretion protein